MSNEVLEFEALEQVLLEQGADALIHDLEESGDADALAVSVALREALAALEHAQLDTAPLAIAQLATQLLGRLDPQRSAALAALLVEARRFTGAPWLEPLRPFTSREPQPLRTLSGHTNFVGGLVVLPDSRTLASSSEDGTIRIWDMETGEQLRELREHGAAVNYLALTPDGTRMLSAGDDHAIRVWDVVDWSVVQVLRGHTGYVSKVMANRDGVAVSVSNDQTVRVWDLGSGKALKTFKDHGAWVYAMAMSPDGKSAITASLNHTMIQWDLSDDKPKKQRTIIGEGNEDVHMLMGDVYFAVPNQTGRGHKDAPNAMAWSADGRKLVSASNDVVVWDTGDLSEVARFADHAWPIKAACFFDGDRKIAVGEHCIKIWDLDSGAEAASWIGHEGKQIYSLAVSPDGKRLVTGDDKGGIKIWDVDAALQHNTSAPGHAERVYPMSFSPDDSMLLSTSCDKSGIIWDVASASPRHHLRGHDDIFVYARGWLGGGAQAITVCRGAMRIWDSASGELVREIKPTLREEMSYDPRQGYDFIGVETTSDERRAICGAVGEGLSRVDLGSGQMEFFEGFTAFNQEIVLSQDERFALTSSYYSSYTGSDEVERPGVEERMCPAQLWDIERLELVHNLFPEVALLEDDNDTDYSCQVAFSADESLIFGGSSQGALRVWDRETGELVREHRLDPAAYANQLRINEAGEVELLTVHEQQAMVHRFDAQGRALLERRVVALPSVVRYALSDDWRLMAATCSDQLVALVDLTTGHPLAYAAMASEVSEMALSHAGDLLAVGDTQGQVHLLRIHKG